MQGFPATINTRHDVGNLLADPDYHDATVAHLQLLMDERYAYDASGSWGIVEPNGLTRLGVTTAEAVALGAVDRVIDEPAQAVDLTALQAAASVRIDAQAESLCNQVVTPGSAQMARYQRKEAQARGYLEAAAAGLLSTDADAVAAAYPAVIGEVGITADTAKGVAEAIVARANAWWEYGDAVERVRLAAKRAVEAATDPAGVQAAVAAVVWPAVPE